MREMNKLTLLLVLNKDLDAVTKGRSQPPWDFLKENLEAGCVGEDLTLQHSAPPMSQNSKRADKNIIDLLNTLPGRLKIGSYTSVRNKRIYNLQNHTESVHAWC